MSTRTMNFERTQTFKGYGTRQQWTLVAPKADIENGVEVATAASTTILGSLFNVNAVDGDPVGVITEQGVRVIGIASEAITSGALLIPADNGKVKPSGNTTGMFVALTSATKDGEFVEMISKA